MRLTGRWLEAANIGVPTPSAFPSIMPKDITRPGYSGRITRHSEQARGRSLPAAPKRQGILPGNGGQRFCPRNLNSSTLSPQHERVEEAGRQVPRVFPNSDFIWSVSSAAANPNRQESVVSAFAQYDFISA
jgi:hypothetical protein